MFRWLFLILILGIFTRLIFLSTVPPGISHDELEFVNNGYSLVKTGKDLTGTVLPLTVGGVGHVALPAYFSGVSTFIFGLSIWSVRLVPAIFGILEIIIVYAIGYSLFKSSKAAVFSSLILVISAWGLKISRDMFDPPTSLFCFLVAIWLSVSARSSRRLVFSAIFAGLGFLSYYGAIFTYLPLVLTLVLFRLDLIRIHPKVLIGISAVVVFTLSIYAAMIINGGHNQKTLGRENELIFFNSQKITDNVIFDRSYSQAPVWTDRIFINKATYLFHQFYINYLGAFSPQMIWVTGDPTPIYGMWDRGELPLFTLPFTLIGAFYILNKNRRVFWFLLAILLIAPLTVGLSSPVFATRAGLIWPTLILFAGMGMAVGVSSIKNKALVIKYPLYLGMVIILFYSYLSVFHQYFYRYPTYASEMWFDSEHQLADYLVAHPGQPTDIYGPENRPLFMEYYFYSQADPRAVQSAFSANPPTGPIHFKSLAFLTGCPSGKSASVVQIVHASCGPDSKYYRPLITTRDKSSRVMWYIYAKPY